MGLMTAGLPLMKGALTSPAKSVLLLCYNLDYQQQHQQDMQLFKKISWIRSYFGLIYTYSSIHNVKERNERYNENS